MVVPATRVPFRSLWYLSNLLQSHTHKHTAAHPSSHSNFATKALRAISETKPFGGSHKNFPLHMNLVCAFNDDLLPAGQPTGSAAVRFGSESRSVGLGFLVWLDLVWLVGPSSSSEHFSRQTAARVIKVATGKHRLSEISALFSRV